MWLSWDQENYKCSKLTTIVSKISHGIVWEASGTYSVKIDRSIPPPLSIVFPFGFIGVQTKLTLVCPHTHHPLADYHQFMTRMIKSIHVFRSMDRVYLFSLPELTIHAIDCIAFSIVRVHILGSHIFGTLEWRKFLVSRDFKIRRRIAVKFCYRITKSDLDGVYNWPQNRL